MNRHTKMCKNSYILKMVTVNHLKVSTVIKKNFLKEICPFFSYNQI